MGRARLPPAPAGYAWRLLPTEEPIRLGFGEVHIWLERTRGWEFPGNTGPGIWGARAELMVEGFLPAVRNWERHQVMGEWSPALTTKMKSSTIYTPVMVDSALPRPEWGKAFYRTWDPGEGGTHRTFHVSLPSLDVLGACSEVVTPIVLNFYTGRRVTCVELTLCKETYDNSRSPGHS